MYIYGITRVDRLKSPDYRKITSPVGGESESVFLEFFFMK